MPYLGLNPMVADENGLASCEIGRSEGTWGCGFGCLSPIDPLRDSGFTRKSIESLVLTGEIADLGLPLVELVGVATPLVGDINSLECDLQRPLTCENFSQLGMVQRRPPP